MRDHQFNQRLEQIRRKYGYGQDSARKSAYSPLRNRCIESYRPINLCQPCSDDCPESSFACQKPQSKLQKQRCQLMEKASISKNSFRQGDRDRSGYASKEICLQNNFQPFYLTSSTKATSSPIKKLSNKTPNSNKSANFCSPYSARQKEEKHCIRKGPIEQNEQNKEQKRMDKENDWWLQRGSKNNSQREEPKTSKQQKASIRELDRFSANIDTIGKMQDRIASALKRGK